MMIMVMPLAKPGAVVDRGPDADPAKYFSRPIQVRAKNTVTERINV